MWGGAARWPVGLARRGEMGLARIPSGAPSGGIGFLHLLFFCAFVVYLVLNKHRLFLCENIEVSNSSHFRAGRAPHIWSPHIFTGAGRRCQAALWPAWRARGAKAENRKLEAG